MSERTPLGWREWIGLPELDIPRIKAKIDTGARTSALQGDTEREVQCEAPVKDRRVVRDSGGHEELRYVIDTQVEIGEDRFRAEMTLTDRDTMAFRILLGRTALRARYVIHPGRSYLQGKPTRRKKET